MDTQGRNNSNKKESKMTDIKYPVSLDEFKEYFLREAGIEYQPYPSWVKTVFDTDEECVLNGVFYKSVEDMNITSPEAPEQTSWLALTYVYIAGDFYYKDDIVLYNAAYYKALVDTDNAPNTTDWYRVKIEDYFPDARPWKEPIAYNEGDRVIRVVKNKVGVWESTTDTNYTDPAIETLVPETEDTYYWEENEEATEELQDIILDWDILRAMGEAAFKFNPRLFTEDKGKIIFLYLAMFFLVYDRQMAASGVNGNSAAGPVIHRTVGKMTVSYMESTLFKSNPSYEFLASNDYGKKAYQLMAPYLRGNVQILRGGSTGE